MRQATKTIVAVLTITATATAIQEVARANFRPAIIDQQLPQSQSADIRPFAEPMQFRSDGPVAFMDLQRFGSSGPLPFTGLQPSVSSNFSQSEGPIAFIYLQQQVAVSYSPAKSNPPLVSSVDGTDGGHSLAGSLQLASLDQPVPPVASPPARDPELAPQHYASLEPSRGVDRSPAHRLGVPLSRIQFDAPALAPMSHTFFCLRYKDDCKVDAAASPDSIVTLTSDKWKQLERVNAAVNRAIIPQPNTKGLAGEVWLISPRAGECHDYAVTKRHELLALGWPQPDLLLAEVVTSWGEHHLVLVVRTSDGDFVADNLTPKIRPWSQAPYEWVRIQSPGNPVIWSTLLNATAGARARAKARQEDPS